MQRRHTHSTTAALEDAIALMARNMIEEENQAKIRLAHAYKIQQILGTCRKGPHEYNAEKANGGTMTKIAKQEDLHWIGFDGYYVIERSKLRKFIEISGDLMWMLKSTGHSKDLEMAGIIQELLNELEAKDDA